MPEINDLVKTLLPFLHSPLGAICFIPLYAIWVTLLLPGVWASMLAGVIYGTALGSAIVFAGAFLGAEVVFIGSRKFLRGWFEKRLDKLPKVKAIEKAVSQEGLKIVLLTRLSPAFPFSLLNLAYGLSDIKIIDYSLGLIGILPGTILFCGLGSLAADLTKFRAILSGEGNYQIWALRVIGLISTLCIVWLIGRTAKNILNEL